jgi:hypothetical protein
MKRNLILGILGLAGLTFLSSCGDDTPTPSGVSFELADQSTTESDGTIKSVHPDLVQDGQGKTVQVKLVFDKALPGATVIKYKIDGTASKINPVPASGSDFEVNDFDVAEGTNLTLTTDELTIAKGATEAIINVTVYEDYEFEYDKNVVNSDKVSYETIIFTMMSVVSGPAKLGTQVTHTINITEDDAVFLLQWGTNNTTSAGDVDMDLLFSLNNELVWGSASDGTYEIVNFPGGFPEGQYGLSYTYYAGTSDDVDFAMGVYTTSGSVNGQKYNYGTGNPLVFKASYTLKNINKWSDTSPPKVVQTMTKSGINYTNFSTITVPADGGSRFAENNFRLTSDMLDTYNSIEGLRKFAARNSKFGKLKAN